MKNVIKTSKIKYVIGALCLSSAMTQYVNASGLSIDPGYTYTFSDATTYDYTDGGSNTGTNQSLGAADSITLNGGTLTFSDQNIDFSGHAITVADASTIDLADATQVYGTIFGSFSGTAALTLKKDIYLANPITYTTGTKTIYQYCFAANHYFTSATAVQDAASDPSVTGTLDGADILILKGASLFPSGADITLPNPIQILVDSIIDTSSNNMTLSGAISGEAALSLPSTDVTKYLTVNHACPNYTGTITLSGNGMIEFGVENCMSNASIANEKIVDLNGHSQIIKNLTGAGQLVSYPAAGTTGDPSDNADAVSLTVNLTADKTFTGILHSSLCDLNLVSGNDNINSFTLDASTAQNNITGTTAIGAKIKLQAKFPTAKPVNIAADGELALLDNSQLSKLESAGTVDLKGKNLTILGTDTTNDLGTVTNTAGGTVAVTIGNGTDAVPTVALGTTCEIPLNVKNGSTLKVTGNISLPKFTVS